MSTDEELVEDYTEDSEDDDEDDGKFYVSTYCNFAHDIATGRPMNHECVVIPSAALQAEMDGDFDKAIEIMKASRKQRN
jgi:hypothetical protein